MIRRAPVTFEDLLNLYAASFALKPHLFAAAVLQIARAQTVGWYTGDRLDAAGILYPLDTPGADHREVLFVARPGAGLPMVAIVHFARLTLAALPDDVRLTVHARTHAGERLAALCGLRAAGGDIWEWSADVRLQARDLDAVQRRRHVRTGRGGEPGAG